MVGSNIHELYSLEQLAAHDSFIHRLHPMAKLLATAIFIVTVLSFDRYSFGRLVPYIFYPTVLMAISDTPYFMLLKRFLVALPFCLFAGVSNIIFDTATATSIVGIPISYGMLSFFTLLFRAYLSIMAVLLLIATTPLIEITSAMRQLKIPNIFITIFEMTYRYMGVLFEEAYSMYIAYSLRSIHAKGVRIKDMGSFVGQLLLRSFDRADRVYNAMKCRGFSVYSTRLATQKLEFKNIAFLAIVCLLCVAFRLWGMV